MDEIDEEREDATKQVLQLLEEWGSEAKFIWFREIHRITDIDKGLLRNVINDLKKYYKKCRDVENRFKGKAVMLKDGSRVKVYQNTTKSSERTRKRLEKQKQKRQVKAYTKMKSRAKMKNRTRPHKS